MKNIKRILVGLDVVERSNNVLKRALIVAKENNAELFIVHVVRTPWLAVPSYFGSKKITVDTKGITKKIEKKIKALSSKQKVPYRIFVKEGDVDDILLYESKLLKTEMIIIGAQSKKKGKKNHLGTIAQKVAHQSKLPVLVIKNSVQKAYKNIIVPTDFEEQSRQSILFAKNVFSTAKLNLVNAVETLYLMEGPYMLDGTYFTEDENFIEYTEMARSGASRRMKDFLKEVSVKKGKVLDGDLDSKSELVKYINKGSFDLVVVASHENSVVNALLGSVANYILRESKRDVLVYVP